ncbi:hypothetical protein QTP86_022420, partial [Hemibagrus guttatus]
YTVYKLNKDTDGSFFPFVFGDTMGLEEGSGGVRTNDIISILNGHMQEGYTFNHQMDLNSESNYYNTNPSLEDKVHCLVFVLPADSMAQIHQGVTDKIKLILNRARELGIPLVVIMTKVDVACPLVKENLKMIYKSKRIRNSMEKCSIDLGIPLKYIFPVKNYHEEINNNKEIDILLLMASTSIVNFANDFVKTKVYHYRVTGNLEPVPGVYGHNAGFYFYFSTLNVEKTKEMVVDFRRAQSEHSPLDIDGSNVEIVKSTKFLNVHLAEDLTWSLKTSSITKKAQQHLYFLQRLRKAHLTTLILSTFYRGTIESILSSCITAWFGNCTPQAQATPSPPPAATPCCESPQMGLPDKFDGSADRCRGFIRQCGIFFAQQPDLYEADTTSSVEHEFRRRNAFNTLNNTCATTVATTPVTMSTTAPKDPPKLRKLTPAEANYDVGNRELLYIKAALEEWQHWLEGARHPSLVLTDHRNLEYLRGAKYPYSAYKLKKDTDGSFFPFVFGDTMGLEEGSGGVRTNDIISILNGHMQEGYTFNHQMDLNAESNYYNTTPSLKDKVHCLVFVLPANSTAQIPQGVTDQMKQIQEGAHELYIPVVAIMTKVDVACSLVKKNLTMIYKSKNIKKNMEQCSIELGIPVKYIFPVKNYHEEIENIKEIDVLILMALKNIVNFASDYVNRKL